MNAISANGVAPAPLSTTTYATFPIAGVWLVLILVVIVAIAVMVGHRFAGSVPLAETPQLGPASDAGINDESAVVRDI